MTFTSLKTRATHNQCRVPNTLQDVTAPLSLSLCLTIIRFEWRCSLQLLNPPLSLLLSLSLHCKDVTLNLKKDTKINRVVHFDYFGNFPFYKFIFLYFLCTVYSVLTEKILHGPGRESRHTWKNRLLFFFLPDSDDGSTRGITRTGTNWVSQQFRENVSMIFTAYLAFSSSRSRVSSSISCHWLLTLSV